MEKVSDTREIDPDFLLQINFEPGITQAQRIFQTAASMIEALHSCDKLLLESFPAKINPIFVLEQIESGSLKIFLMQILETVSDDALNNMDWKPAIAKYLVKGKYFLLKPLSDGLPPDPEKLVDMSKKFKN